MRNVFLSVVVVTALVIAGVGGTLAGFSDTERSLDNYFEVGNMDLKVSVDDSGNEYNDGAYIDEDGNEGIPPIVDCSLMWPCDSKDRVFDLHNLSDNSLPEEAGYAYMRIKDVECYEVYTTKFPDFRPEPEDVAELGGILANVETPPMGPWGQNCSLADFVEIYINYDDGAMVIGSNNWLKPWDELVYLSDIAGDPGLWVYLGRIPGCTTKYGNISTHIGNWSEEEWNERFPDAQVPDLFEDDKPFNDWLTNLFMNDGVTFTIEFALTQDPIPADQVYNP
jgi:predicted ribosomally synthesized peptide with SipW-like signal peptide